MHITFLVYLPLWTHSENDGFGKKAPFTYRALMINDLQIFNTSLKPCEKLHTWLEAETKWYNLRSIICTCRLSIFIKM